MPLSTRLCDKGLIIYIQCADPVTLLDFEIALGFKNTLIKRSHRRLYQLADMTRITHLPPGLMSLRHKRSLFHQPDAGSLVIIMTNPVFQVILEAVTCLSETNTIHFFDIEANGLAYLQSQIVCEVAV